jgi:hypothetical protein
VKSDDPKLFIDIPINSEILIIEHKFKLVQRKGIAQIIVADKGELDKEDKEDNKGSSVGDDNIILSPLRLVISIDSI